jgi:hypothetical protein
MKHGKKKRERKKEKNRKRKEKNKKKKKKKKKLTYSSGATLLQHQRSASLCCAGHVRTAAAPTGHWMGDQGGGGVSAKIGCWRR